MQISNNGLEGDVFHIKSDFSMKEANIVSLERQVFGAVK
jgi:hypothetical protein